MNESRNTDSESVPLQQLCLLRRALAQVRLMLLPLRVHQVAALVVVQRQTELALVRPYTEWNESVYLAALIDVLMYLFIESSQYPITRSLDRRSTV